MEKLNLRQWFSLLILGFTAAAVGGWLYEELCVYVMYGYIYKRGMLHLTLCPIYGFGAWGLYALLHKVKQTWAYFLLSVIVASVFEYACSYLLELVFHRSYWTYADWYFSVNDRISLISSVIFGILAVLFAKGILPPLKKWVTAGRGLLPFVLSVCLILLIAGDFVLVVSHY